MRELARKYQREDVALLAGVVLLAAWSVHLSKQPPSAVHALMAVLLLLFAVSYSLIALNREKARRLVALQEEHDRTTLRLAAVEELLRTSEESRRRDAAYDPLTHLPNLALFSALLERSISTARARPEYSFAVAALYLDRFDVINAGLGRAAADELLLEVSRRIKGCTRPGDTLARSTSASFMVLLDDLENLDAADRVANRISAALKQPLEVAGEEVSVHLRIGLVLRTRNYDRPEELVRAAELALNDAKRSRAGRARVYRTEMRAQAIDEIRIQSDLRRAIERDEISVFYQPIVDGRTRRVEGFEALARWHHPTRGLVSPAEFIPAAESSGAILPIGMAVLEKSCRQMAAWQGASVLPTTATVAVNLSARQFADPQLVDRIAETLSKTGLAPTSLKLEVTESVVMEDVQTAVETLSRLRDLGIRLAIDDFGTGHSSLSYLRRLPVDILKVDRSFVSNMARDPENEEIVRTIIGLAHNLGLRVIAEGAETEEDVDSLAKLGCDLIQGYFFSRPEPGGRVMERVEALNAAADARQRERPPALALVGASG